jgi:hypothetical protein
MRTHPHQDDAVLGEGSVARDDVDILSGEQIEILKHHVQYGIYGWRVKRTIRSKWALIHSNSVLEYVRKKLKLGTREADEKLLHNLQMQLFSA